MLAALKMEDSGRAKYIVWTYPGIVPYLEKLFPLLERRCGYDCKSPPYFELMTRDEQDQTAPDEGINL